MRLDLKFKNTQIVFARTQALLPVGYTHTTCVVRTRSKCFAIAAAHVVAFMFTTFRETFWRIKPDVRRDRDFTDVEDMHLSSVRFSTGKWFGKKHDPKPIEDVVVFGFSPKE